MIVVLLACVLALAFSAVYLLADSRRQRTPPELETDWWPQFEREFRAYAARVSKGSRGHPRPRARRPNPRPR
jgi:hypothetical protein